VDDERLAPGLAPEPAKPLEQTESAAQVSPAKPFTPVRFRWAPLSSFVAEGNSSRPRGETRDSALVQIGHAECSSEPAGGGGVVADVGGEKLNSFGLVEEALVGVSPMLAADDHLLRGRGFQVAVPLGSEPGRVGGL
jgi:hypothetical protein